MLSGPYFCYEDFERDLGRCVGSGAEVKEVNERRKEGVRGEKDGEGKRGGERVEDPEKVFWSVMVPSTPRTSSGGGDDDGGSRTREIMKEGEGIGVVKQTERQEVEKREGLEKEGEWVPAGVLALHRIQPCHYSCEIGYVLFGPSLQRTRAATASIYLILLYSFSLGYNRVEWKCNALNTASRRAARRYGFVEEGTMRAHMVVRGRVRDTSWFSVVRGEWETAAEREDLKAALGSLEDKGREGDEEGEKEGDRPPGGKGRMGVKEAFETWLSPDNFDSEGRQRRGLREVREGDEGGAG